jgi:transposase-like protein
MFHAERGRHMVQRRHTREHWRGLVGGWAGSGLTQAQYCDRHGISAASFYRWREVFRQEREASGGWVARRGEEPVHLLPVQVLAARDGAGEESALRLVFSGGVRLEVSTGFDAATLARVVAVLAERTAA